MREKKIIAYFLETEKHTVQSTYLPNELFIFATPWKNMKKIAAENFSAAEE